ncbi:MAG: metallophosphoesterase [Nanoarchaeota archaeon]
MENVKFVGKCLLIGESGKRILAVGDLHLGYEEHLNQTGIFVSRKMFEEMIEEFGKIFENVGRVDEIVLLGDVKHEFGGIMRQEWSDVLGLFDYLLERCKKIVIVKGNHDNILEPIVNKRENVDLEDFYSAGEFCFLHGDKDFDEIYDKKIKYWVMGHGHPAVKISDGIKVEKYKCFLAGKFKGKSVLIVPSFFSYNEGSDPRENELGLAWKFNLDRFEVRVVGKNLKVLDFGRLGLLRL